MDAPNQEGLDLFEEATSALFKLEQYLRKREGADVNAPMFRMRRGIHFFLNQYMANRQICNSATVEEMMATNRIAELERYLANAEKREEALKESIRKLVK
jgi:hypothetical protein